jgi:UDP-N-acetylmuramate dehydrogenase
MAHWPSTGGGPLNRVKCHSPGIADDTAGRLNVNTPAPSDNASSPVEPGGVSDAATRLDAAGIPYDTQAPLGPRTWFQVGGRAEVLATPRSMDELQNVVGMCHNMAIPLRVLGKGANLLVRETTVPGIVIALDAPCFQHMHWDAKAGKPSGEAVTVQAGAGVDLFKLVRETAKAGLSGLENIAGIPATVGGAVRMNAGGAFGEIGDYIEHVTVMHATGETETLPRDQIAFAYRQTDIAAPLILEATFTLTAADPAQTTARMKEIFAYKKTSQPMGDKSAGCAFKNPKHQTDKGAGQLIDEAGLKGATVGGARVSDRHGNFIVVDPDTAAAGDVFALIEHLERTVRRVHGIDLEREVITWP